MRMKRSELRVTFAAVGLAALAVGCVGEVGTTSEGPSTSDEASSASAATSASVGETVKLAELQLSPTHQIVVEQEPDGEVSLTETFNVDEVDYQASLTGQRWSGLTLEDAYDAVAGDAWDQETRQLFREVGAMLEASAVSQSAESITPERLRDDLAALEDGRDSLVTDSFGEFDVGLGSSEATGGPSGETRLVEKACGDPAGWSWAADDGRIKETFCGDQSNFCVTSGQVSNGFAWYGFDETRFMAAVGISQSFCNEARFRYWKRHYDGPPFFGVSESLVKDVLLPPRTFFAHHRSNSGDYAYKARVDHVSGPSVRRVAFSIHVDGLRPPWWPNLPSGW